MLRQTIGLLVALLVATPAFAAPLRWSKIEAAPQYRGWRAELQRVVDEEGRARINHACLVVWSRQPDRGPYDTSTPPPQTVALVLWREGHRVLEWAERGEDGRMLPVPGAGSLDLRHDIVPTAADLRGSTFRQTRAWLASLKRHCAAEGTEVTIIREAR